MKPKLVVPEKTLFTVLEVLEVTITITGPMHLQHLGVLAVVAEVVIVLPGMTVQGRQGTEDTQRNSLMDTLV